MAQECLPGLSPRRTGIVHGSVNVGFMVDKMALGQGFSEFFDSPVSIIPPRIYIRMYRLGDEK
jgi:hypothetical protein